MTSYTDSKGKSVVISDMAGPHLMSAWKKAVATEERRHHTAFINGTTYENAEREAEIDALAAEIAKRDETYAAEQDNADRA